MRTLILAAVLLIPGAAAAGEYKTGQEILEACLQPSGPGAVFCLGYVEGVAGAMSAGPVDNWDACIPAMVTAGDLAQVVAAGLAKRPDMLRGFAASSLVAHVLADAFPCHKSNT
jgi:hypothetical protein